MGSDDSINKPSNIKIRVALENNGDAKVISSVNFKPNNASENGASMNSSEKKEEEKKTKINPPSLKQYFGGSIGAYLDGNPSCGRQGSYLFSN